MEHTNDTDMHQTEKHHHNKHVERTPEEYGRIVGRHEAGQSPAAIAREMNIADSVVRDAVKRFEKTGTATPAKRTGRPQKLSESDKEYLKLSMRRDPSETVKEHVDDMKAAGVDVSRSTMKRRLRELNSKS